MSSIQISNKQDFIDKFIFPKSSSGGTITLEELQNSLGKSYELTSDIDLSDTPICSIGAQIPNRGFTGSFDGKGYTITICKIDRTCFYGLFAKAIGNTNNIDNNLTSIDKNKNFIRNLNIIYKTDIPFKQYIPKNPAKIYTQEEEEVYKAIPDENLLILENNSDDFNSFGFFIGACENYTIENCTVCILDKYSIKLTGQVQEADIKGYENIGGLIGKAQNCYINKCNINIGHYFSLFNFSAIREIYASLCIGNLTNSSLIDTYMTVGRYTAIDLFVPSGFSNTFGSMIGLFKSGIGVSNEIGIVNGQSVVTSRLTNTIINNIISIDHTTYIYCNRTFGSIGGLFGIIKAGIIQGEIGEAAQITNCLGFISNNTLYNITEGNIGGIFGSLQSDTNPAQGKSPQIYECAIMYGKNTLFNANNIGGIIGANINRLAFSIRDLAVYFENYYFNGERLNDPVLGFNIGSLNLTNNSSTAEIPFSDRLYAYSESGHIPGSKLTSINSTTKAEVYNTIKLAYDNDENKNKWVDYLFEFDKSFNNKQMSDAFTKMCIHFKDSRPKLIAQHAIMYIMRNKDIHEFTTNLSTLRLVISSFSNKYGVEDINNITVIIPKDHIYDLQYNKDYYFLEKSITVSAKHPIFNHIYIHNIVSIGNRIYSSDFNVFRTFANTSNIGAFLLKSVDNVIGQIYFTDTEYAKPDCCPKPMFKEYTDKCNIYTSTEFIRLPLVQPPPPPSMQYYAPFYPPNSRGGAYVANTPLAPYQSQIGNSNNGNNYTKYFPQNSQQPLCQGSFYPN
jgi:hypothetical protein